MPRKLLMKIHDENGVWTETYLENDGGISFTAKDTDLQKWSENLINEFNATLRPNDSPRTLDSIEVLEMTPEEIQEVADLYADDEDEDDLDLDDDDEDEDDEDEDEEVDED